MKFEKRKLSLEYQLLNRLKNQPITPYFFKGYSFNQPKLAGIFNSIR